MTVFIHAQQTGTVDVDVGAPTGSGGVRSSRRDWLNRKCATNNNGRQHSNTKRREAQTDDRDRREETGRAERMRRADRKDRKKGCLFGSGKERVQVIRRIDVPPHRPVPVPVPPHNTRCLYCTRCIASSGGGGGRCAGG